MRLLTVGCIHVPGVHIFRTLYRKAVGAIGHNTMPFFWESQLNVKSSKSRSRFNLLLLEHGEYYFEDFFFIREL